MFEKVSCSIVPAVHSIYVYPSVKFWVLGLVKLNVHNAVAIRYMIVLKSDLIVTLQHSPIYHNIITHVYTIRNSLAS